MELYRQLVGHFGWVISPVYAGQQKKHMPQAGFKPIIPVFAQAKTFHALDCVPTVIS
jgi:hypothetical protein